jgi:mercuric ion transport protein
MIPTDGNSAARIPSAWGGLMLTLGGFAAAFSVAACCALPLLFLGLGLSTAWLTTIALIAVPYRGPLLIFSALALVAGAGLLWRQQRAAMSCKPGQYCVSPAVRFLTLAGLVMGAALLWAGYTYV